MKKICFLLLLSFAKMLAQVPNNTVPKYLDKNRVRARINTVNNKFWQIYGNGSNSYEVPKGKGTHAQFANSIWIGGLDGSGQLHISANTYRQSGADFWPGPLDTANISVFTSTATAPYNYLWKVDCSDLDAFAYAYVSGNLASGIYTVPADIANYPARGTANFQKKLEPFHDANNNGLYDPAGEGDYPIIKGHQQILSIYNDQFDIHTETGGAAMGLEIHERAYCYYDPTLPDSMKAVNHSTFYHYTIYNRSNFNYSNVYIGDWSDVDLGGNYTDDFIGTDTVNGFAYCYNADAFDENGAVSGYGNKPPVASHAIIKTPCTTDGIDNDNDGQVDEAGEHFRMTNTSYYLNNIGNVNLAMSNPEVALHYYNYMSGKWKDNTPLTEGGNAYGGVRPTRYVYPGNPATNTGWTETSAGNAAGDRRVIFSSGPFTFPAHGKIEWGYAIVFSQDTSQAVNTITQFGSRVQRDVRNVKYYDETHQAAQCPAPAYVGIQKANGPLLGALIYPNPANDKVNVHLLENIKDANVKLMDLSGRVIKETAMVNSTDVSLDISDMADGVYLIEIGHKNSKAMQKLIKSR